MNKKEPLLRYGVCIFFAVIAFFLVLLLYGYTGALPSYEKYRMLADAFTVPAVLLIMSGALIFLSSRGAFDVVFYGIKRAVGAIVPFYAKDMPSFYEYKKRRSETGAAVYPLLSGSVMLIPAIVFLLLFYYA